MKTPMLKSTIFAALMLAFSGTTSAAGLGRINVFSALGQPLRAEVEIAATPEELDGMVARIAPPDAFKRANVEYVGALSSVKMSIEKRGTTGSVVKIISDRPFSEPFVDMLIELNWSGGRLLREYTFLLDPSDAPGSKAITPAIDPVSRPLPEQRGSRRETTRANVPTASAGERTSGEDYVVKSGDTLGRIAANLKPVEISQEQMIAALYRNNAEAFSGGNINRLRAGKILKVPDADTASKIAPSEARKIIVRASNFDQYRQTVATATQNAPAKESSSGQAASGKIAPKVEESSGPVQESKDRVKVTATQVAKTADTAAVDTKTKANSQALQDELASRDKALKEANSRVADLEKSVKELQKLVELKNQGLADAQKQADAAAKDAKTRAEEAERAPAAASKPAPASAPGAAESSVAAAPVQQSAVAESTPVEQSASVAQPAPAKPKPPVAVQAPPALVEEDGIFGNPLAWAGIGIAALGAAYVVVKQRRRSQVAATTQLTEASTTSQNSVFGNAGGQTVDTGGTSLLHTDFSQSGLSAIDTDEGVDPVAEADVYMAYGRDAQAEEILLDALKNDPTRAAVYLKLLEIYSQRKSVKQFENVASDLFTQTGGAGEDWEKAAALGQRLDPENPLYRPASEGKVTGVAAVAAAVVAATVIDTQETAESEAPEVKFGTQNVSQMHSTWTVPGEISQFSSSEEAGMPELPVVPDAPAAQSESLNLDFNLDLELSESEDQPTQMEASDVFAPSSVLSAPEIVETEEEPLPVVAAVDSTKPDAQATEMAAMLPLEFDLGLGMGGDEEEVVVAVEPDQEAELVVPPISVAEADEGGLGIERVSGQDVAFVDLEKTNFESSLLDFDFELGDEITKTAVDLSDLNLGATHLAVPQAAPISAESTVADQELPIQDSIDVDDEISTKLELARAYEEMGDVEGARELLEEVIADGVATQQDEARSILNRLG